MKVGAVVDSADVHNQHRRQAHFFNEVDRYALNNFVDSPCVQGVLAVVDYRRTHGT